MEAINEALMNAELAFTNKQFVEALHWYQEVLSDSPDDPYALSRAGAICIPLGRFDEALRYFERAKNLDPQIGDHLFNYANACFFHQDYAKAFTMYADAERTGCSDDVMPRLYFQMAVLCSIRQDIKSSLVYFKKCEAADRDGLVAFSPDVISEKIKLYLSLQDYENAEKCSAQLIAVEPLALKNYMLRFSILMAHKKYAEAEKILADANQYAELTANDRFTLTLQHAALLMAKGTADGQEYFEQAIDLLETYTSSTELNDEQKYQVMIALSEAYQKAELYDKSIDCLRSILSSGSGYHAALRPDEKECRTLSDDEIERMIQDDMTRIQEKIDRGEIDKELGMYAQIEYDEDGNEQRVYNETAFSFLDSDPRNTTSENMPEEHKVGSIREPLIAVREKIYYMLLSAYLGKDDYAGAARFAEIVKHSDNKYYAYYGLYTSVLMGRKMYGNTPEVERKYAEAIAFFRNKAFLDHSDFLASIFRARLYIEQGKRVKAMELAALLSEEDRKAILDYDESYHNS